MGAGDVDTAAPFGDEENNFVGQEVRRACISRPMIVWWVGKAVVLASPSPLGLEDMLVTRPVVRSTDHVRLLPAAVVAAETDKHRHTMLGEVAKRRILECI